MNCKAKYGNVWVLIFFSLSIFAQHLPVIQNFNAQNYKAHHQNWDITQGSDRMMYFGNTQGLLSFNGNAWQINKSNSNKIIRSVYAHRDRIYAGGYEEIGYWTKDVCNRLKYYDLKDKLLPGTIENEEIWHITSEGDVVFFQSFSVLLAFDGQKFSKINLPGSVMFLYVIDGMKYIQVIDKGIYYLNENLQAIKLPGSDFFNNKIVTSFIRDERRQSIIITTTSDGVFTYKNGKISLWNETYNTYFSEVQINKAIRMINGYIAIGTIRNGLLIFNVQGDLMYHINTNSGLQNNTILSIHEDVDHQLWVGLDKGISVVHLNEDILQFKDVKGQIGSVYTAAMLDSILYLGTNQGVYVTNLKKHLNKINSPDFTLVKGTQGQTWHLFAIQNSIFCGHNDGSFLIKNGTALKLSDITGGWYNEVFSKNGQTYILQGNYTGLSLFKVSGGKVSFSHQLEGYRRPVKKFYIKDQYIWVTGPNNGLSKLHIDGALNKVTFLKKYAFPGGNNNHDNIDIYLTKDTLYISDGTSHFYLDTPSDQIQSFDHLNADDNGYSTRILHDAHWLKIYSSHAIRMNDQKIVKHLLFAFNQDYHNVVNLKNGWFLYCLDDGYILDKIQASSAGLAKRNFPIYYTVHYNSTICQPANLQSTIVIPYGTQNLYFQLYDFLYTLGKQYEYRVQPFQDEWKQVENNGKISFANLNYGMYVLDLKRSDGILKQVQFEILPPWFFQTYMKVIYLLIISGLFFLLKWYYDKKLKSEKQVFQDENQRLIKAHQIQIENQRLMSENLVKNKELANATLQLVQKNEILQEIKDELIDIRKSGDPTITTKDFQLFMKQINDNLTTKSDKKLFDASFDDVHEAFFKKLKMDYPDLSADDLKLAAYLRMNLSSKDIAPLFNISIRGLENKRYRLRKKLKLDFDVNLTEYFHTYIQ